MPVGRQIFLVTLLLCAVVFCALITAVNLNVAQSAGQVAEKNLTEQLKLMADLMDYAHRQGVSRAKRYGDIFMKALPGPVTVEAKTMPTGPVELPILRIGGQIMNGDTTLLEKFRDIGGAEIAVVMRHKGELYRVSTMLKDKDGKSMNGSLIPKGDPTERIYSAGVEASTVIERSGIVFALQLIPVKDEKGNMIAAITSRADLTPDMADFKKIINSRVVGKTGYIYALRPTDDERGGVFVTHPKLEGKTMKDAFANEPELLARINAVIKARNGVFHYDRPDPTDGGKTKDKFVIYVHVPTWDWILGGGSYVYEFLDEARALRNQLIVESVLAAVLLMALIYLMVMSSLKRMKPVLAAMERQGAGDLTARVEGVAEKSTNELDVLARRFNQSSGQIQSLVVNLAGAVKRIGGSSDELERSAGEIAKSTSQQSEAAASMAASVEELTVSISHVADSAAEASSATHAAQDASTQGSKEIGHSIAEMQRIAAGINGTAEQINQLGERSRQISGIIKTIGEIAGQTNLLALNAAIEAARAGEQGRGFAVVADEVRKLSERTGASAQEIAAMIGSIQAETESAVQRMNIVAKEVTGGVELVQNVGVSLEKIDARTRDTTTLAGQIASAVTEQKVASEDIARRLESIAQAAEENAALTGNNREVAQTLRECAGELQGQIGRFRVVEQG